MRDIVDLHIELETATGDHITLKNLRLLLAYWHAIVMTESVTKTELAYAMEAALMRTPSFSEIAEHFIIEYTRKKDEMLEFIDSFLRDVNR